MSRAVPLPSDRESARGGLPIGYHELVVECGGLAHRATVLVAPDHVHQLGDRERLWGVFAPVYALRRSTGAGPDLGGLARVADWIDGHGGKIVATLPMLSTFLDRPCDPSPYSPVSRRFWNEIYLDLARLPEMAEAPRARRLLEGAGTRRGPRAERWCPELRRRRAVTHGRRGADRAGHGALLRGPRGVAGFDRWIDEHPLATDYARFRAVVEQQGAGWREWPERLRDGRIGEGDYDVHVAARHVYAQWSMDRQLAELSSGLSSRGQLLYLDLPIGAGGDGFDTWIDRDAYAWGMAVGAPPDEFFAAGQNWGFPPLRPSVGRAEGHRHLAECLRHHMTHAGMLRLDHVMGLHRLFFVPDGMAATDGVYVRYPADEQFAVVAIESVRAGCAVVGEDLGTVPTEVRDAMDRHRVLRSFVAEFSMPGATGDDFIGPDHRSVASVDTHDTPTFAAFVRGADLDARRDEGRLPDDDAARALADRRRACDALAAVVAARGIGDVQPAGRAPALLGGLLSMLGESESPAVLVGIDDLVGETEPQNVPGTGPDRPNWVLRLPLDLDELADDPSVAALLDRLQGARLASYAAGVSMSRPDLLGDQDLWLFNEGAHTTLYERLGAQLRASGGSDVGVWAPNAAEVSVVGDFNGWKPGVDQLEPRGRSGIWQGEVPSLSAGERYKFHLRSRVRGYEVDKADPFAFRTEEPPRTASVAWDLGYGWGDAAWMAHRGAANALDAPMTIYELHLGSWRHVEGAHRSLDYREIAEPLARYLTETGYTHVEFMPVMEHPFYGSWGYQTTGYFAPTSRFGTPQDFMALVDTLHQHGVGVILDWVPSHFPEDEHGLGFFDGTHLYEHADPRKGFHPDWKSLIFNYDRYEVRSFLLSSAHFWLDRYHAGRPAGRRGRVHALPRLLPGSRGVGAQRARRQREPRRAPVPEEAQRDRVRAASPTCRRSRRNRPPGRWSRARPTWAASASVSSGTWAGCTTPSPTSSGTRSIAATRRASSPSAWCTRSPRTSPCRCPTTRSCTARGRCSSKMPGDRWQQLANLRALLGYQYGQPGKKLLFMGDDMAMEMEWDHDDQLPWWILQRAEHEGIRRWVETLNGLVRGEPALHELDFEPAGFEWVDASDSAASVLSFLRRPRRDAEGRPSTAGGRDVLVVANLTPVPRSDYSVGVPVGGRWAELANSDGQELGGSGLGNLGGVVAVAPGAHGRPWSLPLTLPPLSVVFLAPDGSETVASPGGRPALRS